MIIAEANNNVHLRWRDENGERQSSVDLDYKPYFYIATGSDMPEVIQTNGRFGVKRVRPTYNFGDWSSLDGQTLVKVVFETTGDLYNARNSWDKTYEADISMARKYTNDVKCPVASYSL